MKKAAKAAALILNRRFDSADKSCCDGGDGDGADIRNRGPVARL